MELSNYMEVIVKRTLEELLEDPAHNPSDFPPRIKLDILAYTLNHLPPRYIVTEKGHLYTRVDELKHQFRTDILVELSKAIKHIKANPR